MKKPRILLVDDEMAFADNLMKILSKRGYDVIVVYNGADAVSMIGEKEFDVIILDMKMPGMNGIATLKEIKKKTPFVEVVILTGHGSVESGIEGMQLGAFDFLMKPVKVDDLQEKVSEAYRRKLVQGKRG
ncbi:MAG: two-component system response regulator [Desulfobacterium sp.]|nr:two-component system response regulator [Desulfobacterium sp.]